MPFHPSYAFSDADIVLSSKDDCKFHVHSVILKRASGFFRDLLSMQRDAAEAPADPIQMDESQDVLKVFLDVCYPEYSLLVSDIKSFENLRTLAFLFSEKYDVPAGVVAVRALFHDTRIVSTLSPILLYGLAKEFSWDDEAAVMSKATLDIDFKTEDEEQKLCQLRGQDVVALMQLRRSRRDKVLRMLYISNCSVIYLAWHGTCYDDCRDRMTIGDNPSWEAFQFYLFKELDTRPSGRGLQKRDFWNRSWARNLSEIGTCSSCGSPIIDTDRVYKRVQEALKT